MGITAERLARERLVDEVLSEPLGGAHRDPQAMAETLKSALVAELEVLNSRPIAEVVAARAERIESFGVYRQRDT